MVLITDVLDLMKHHHLIDGKICNFNTISEIRKTTAILGIFKECHTLTIKTSNPLKLHQEIGQWSSFLNI